MFRKNILSSDPSPLSSLGVSDKHRRRIKLLLLFGSCLVILVGSGWASYFALQANWVPASLDVLLAVIGGFALTCTLTDRLRTASVLSVPLLFVVICTFCLFMDGPWTGVPRSVHMHLVSLAACSILLFRGEKALFRIGFPLACFAACLAFACTDLGFPIPRLLPPPEVLTVGVWLNHALSFLMLGVVMLVMQADVSVRNAIEAGGRCLDCPRTNQPKTAKKPREIRHLG